MTFSRTIIARRATASMAVTVALLMTPGVAQAAGAAEVGVPPATVNTQAQGTADQPVEEPAPKPPAQRVNNEITLPGWMVFLVAGAVISSAVVVATQSYLRFRRTRQELEG